MAQKRHEEMKARYSIESAFHALGLPDADDLVVKADIVARIETIIRDRGLTQARAAALLDIDQPKVIERLVRALRDLGQDV